MEKKYNVDSFNLDHTKVTAPFVRLAAKKVGQKGDIVTTSGIGGIYPANLIVGKVEELRYNEYDATKFAVVKPYENIKKVTDVVVLTDFKNKGVVKQASKKEAK